MVRVRHVVWDWNGTLLDDHVAVVSAVNRALVGLHLAPITADDYRTHFTRPVQRFYERLAGRPIGVDEWRRLDEAYHQSYQGSLKGLRLAHGAREALEAAERMGLTQSLLSMWRHRELVPLVERLGIGHFFVRVDGLRVAGGDTKAEHLAEHLDALGLQGGEVLVVGDSLDDLAAARSVGARCVLYDGGSHHRRALEAARVPVVETLAAALEVIGDRRSAPGRRQGNARRRPAR
jgi:phosphoglycolate phosphatase-like HAD superfamily hydrolase